MTIRVASAVLAICCAVPAGPPQPQPSSRFVLASVVSAATDTPLLGLAAEDFVVQEGTTRCDTIAVTTAHYPIAILVDTSQAARTEFTQMRKAVRQLVTRMSGRDVALYSFGDRAFRVADFTRDTTRLERAVDQLFALPDGESHVLDAVIEAGRDLARREPAVAMIVVVSAGANDQSNRTPREVFEPVLASRSIVHVVEMRSIGASGRLGNVRGRRNFTTDRAAEAALGLQELLKGLVDRTRGDYDHVFAASGYYASLDRLHQRLSAEVVLEYASSGGPASDLRVGTRLAGGAVRGIGLDRAPREP
jgi:von Willebrand factor type A domain